MKPYIPDELPLNNIDWTALIQLIGSANRELAKFDSTLKLIPNPNVLLSPLTTNEAVLSSKIEGTQATLQDVLKYEASPNKNNPKFNDIQEILNYRKAINIAINELTDRPLNLNLIKQIHKKLMDSVRGENKAAGEFRKLQNWIAAPGSPIENAFYIPPEPARLIEYLSKFEKYIHFEEKDRIVQLAIVHAQFEILHPFLDGNGRLGRILIPLFLFEKKLLANPVFYMSEYLEANRPEYYSKLRNISDHQMWQEWIEFFMRAFVTQAKNNTKKAEAIIELYEKMKRVIHDFNFRDSFPTLDALFSAPVFNSSDFTKYSKINRASENRYLNKLEEENIITLIEKSSGRKPNIFIFPELLSIVQT